MRIGKYPNATWVPADRSNYRAGGLDRPIEQIVIHITDGHPDARPVAEMWQQPKHGSSAHFVVGQDGVVLQAIDCNDIAWHAHAANADSIGIEHCARSPGSLGKGDLGLSLAEVQLTASVQLVAWLCSTYNIPIDRAHILGHSEADRITTHLDCPNGVTGGWPWDRYIEMVLAAIASMQIC